MILGLNLSFAVKRWLEPERLAYMCRQELGVEHVQFTWDLIDPWWPEEGRNKIAQKYKAAFEREQVKIDASFGGLASYTYAHFLAPDPIQREIAFRFFQRAIDLTLELGSYVLGSPIGGMDYAEARNPQKREERYREMLEWVTGLTEYGKKKGLREIQIEATPLITEFPHDPETSLRMMEDLKHTEIPVKLLIDWGHALFQPLLKEKADILLWFEQCKAHIGAIHLQQTDGMLDRHWDFTKSGIVTPQLIREAILKNGLENIPQYVEVIYPFEEEDDAVLENVRKTMSYLKQELGA